MRGPGGHQGQGFGARTTTATWSSTARKPSHHHCLVSRASSHRAPFRGNESMGLGGGEDSGFFSCVPRNRVVRQNMQSSHSSDFLIPTSGNKQSHASDCCFLLVRRQRSKVEWRVSKCAIPCAAEQELVTAQGIAGELVPRSRCYADEHSVQTRSSNRVVRVAFELSCSLCK